MSKISQKAFIRGFAILWFLVAIILMSVANVGIDEEFNFLTWLSNSLILLGIMVFGLLMGESIGEERNKNNDKGLFQLALTAYNAIRQEIDDIIIYFSNFYEWYMSIDLKKKKIAYLEACGVSQVKAKNIVNYCDYEDYEDLVEHTIRKGDVYIKRLLDQEKEPVFEVLNNKIKLDANSAPFYLQAFVGNTSVSTLEQGKKLQKERQFNKRANRFVKISTSVIVSLVIGLLAVKDFMDAGSAAAWVNLISRVATLFTSLVSGWLSATIDVKIQAEILENKAQVLSIFKSAYNKHLFSTLDENEQAKAEYEQYEKELIDKEKGILLVGNDFSTIKG